MDQYGLVCRIISFIALFLAFVHGVDGIYCRYRDGFNYDQLEKCPEMCCDGYATDRESACCSRDMSPSIYVGVTVGTMFVVSVILMCCLYLYCRHSILRTSRAAEARRANTRLRPSVRSAQRAHRRQHSAPSVSVILMEPTLPPAYDSLPPPYYLPKESNPSIEEPAVKEGSLELPDYPPPEYTATPTGTT